VCLFGGNALSLLSCGSCRRDRLSASGWAERRLGHRAHLMLLLLLLALLDLCECRANEFPVHLKTTPPLEGLWAGLAAQRCELQYHLPRYLWLRDKWGRYPPSGELS